MFDVGMFELLLIMIMGLVVLGPERLPEAARLIGAWISKAKRTMADIKTGVEQEVHAHEMRTRIKAELEKAGLDDLKAKFEEQEALFRQQLQNGAQTPPNTPAATSKTAPIEASANQTDADTTNAISSAHDTSHHTANSDFDDEAHHDCNYVDEADNASESVVHTRPTTDSDNKTPNNPSSTLEMPNQSEQTTPESAPTQSPRGNA